MYPLSYEFKLTTCVTYYTELNSITKRCRDLVAYKATPGELHMDNWFTDLVDPIIISARENMFGDLFPVHRSQRYFRGYYIASPLSEVEESGLLIYQPFLCDTCVENFKLVVLGQAGTNWMDKTVATFVERLDQLVTSLEQSPRVLRAKRHQYRVEQQNLRQGKAKALLAASNR